LPVLAWGHGGCGKMTEGPKKGTEAESKSKPVGADRCQPASANC